MCCCLRTIRTIIDIRASYKFGAKGFITKPDSLTELREQLASIEKFLPIECPPLRGQPA